jgi:hypothetical protein
MWCAPYHTARFLENFIAKEFETDVLQLSEMTEGTGREMQVRACGGA